ncbi:hypothetical protein MKZ38_005107 [Zalerion maritima]|uniref:Uncharacterized protein n=1 Tax=Zalerion maritima TaxID=339359 RepID=A0AAD5WQK2_9PEZI|nr:hypothetical protein MKZ38_005107 [Zalerion maritima]
MPIATRSSAAKPRPSSPHTNAELRTLDIEITTLVSQVNQQGTKARKKLQTMFATLIKRCNRRFKVSLAEDRQPVAFYIYGLFPGASRPFLTASLEATFCDHHAELSVNVKQRAQSIVSLSLNNPGLPIHHYISSIWDFYFLFGRNLAASIRSARSILQLLTTHPALDFDSFYSSLLSQARKRLRLPADEPLTVGSARALYLLHPKDITTVAQQFSPVSIAPLDQDGASPGTTTARNMAPGARKRKRMGQGDEGSAKDSEDAPAATAAPVASSSKPAEQSHQESPPRTIASPSRVRQTVASGS